MIREKQPTECERYYLENKWMARGKEDVTLLFFARPEVARDLPVKREEFLKNANVVSHMVDANIESGRLFKPLTEKRHAVDGLIGWERNNLRYRCFAAIHTLVIIRILPHVCVIRGAAVENREDCSRFVWI